ncbi:uncharacterized protein LOC126832236 [Patella vulgata]|uniref:uncharacterized protein LOC126832236 n=1 Tax=Patella vulgata TaxID=6465 RepID=UPI0021805C31|nr:uncharacterized protein LOC126832236 [Patella vulgata]
MRVSMRNCLSLKCVKDFIFCVVLVTQVYGQLDDECLRRFGTEMQVVSSKNLALRQRLICKDTKTPISLRIKQKEGQHHRRKVVIRRCPSVKNVWLHNPSTNGTFYSTNGAAGSVKSCYGVNNTFVLPGNKFGHRDKTILSFSMGSEDPDFLILTYDLKNHDVVNNFAYKIDFNQIDEGRSTLSRQRRETSENSETKVDNSLLPVGCGNDRSCIRYGDAKCAHMECSYFVSYRRIGSTDLEIEISGKTTGWVAVGFSSDDRMGGGDDVVVCKRKGEYSDDVEADSMLNTAPYARPQPKDTEFDLISVKYKDGFIYCKIVRPLKVNMENNLDLYNDWYQLYAKGPITTTGVMLQHEKIPPTSRSKITVLIPVDIVNSMATKSDFCSSVTMTAIIVAFFVS